VIFNMRIYLHSYAADGNLPGPRSIPGSLRSISVTEIHSARVSNENNHRIPMIPQNLLMYT
jgi:hypothetical protein